MNRAEIAMMNDAQTIEDKYLDLKKLSEYSSFSKASLRNYIREGLFPAFRLRGKTIVRKSTFDQWVERFKVQDVNAIVSDVMRSLH